MKTALIAVLTLLLIFYPSYSYLTLENKLNVTLNPSFLYDKGISVIAENFSYVILAEIKNNGNEDTALLIKILPNKTKIWEYEKVIGGSGQSSFHDPYHLIKDKDGNYFWCGEVYQNGWEGGFYLEKISSDGKVLCRYKWESGNSAADEFVFTKEYDNKIFVVGRRHSTTGFIYVFDKNCNLLDKVQHNIGCGYTEGIFSLIKINNTFFILPQMCWKNNYYTVRVYGFDYNKKLWILMKKLDNMTLIAGYGDEYHFLNFSNLFIAGGTHYPSYNISLFAFNSNLSLVYLRTYPFKGTLHRGDLGWKKGTVIYAGGNGFTAYLFNASSGELLAAYNSSLPHKAYALDVKRDFIPGCYVLIGSEKVNKSDWQIRMERICESTFSIPKANFSYISKGLKVIFVPEVKGCDSSCSYFWYFGDGKYSFEKTPTHIYNAKGNYTVSLSVLRNGKVVSIARKKVEIESVFQGINVNRFVPENSELEVEISLSEKMPSFMRFGRVSKSFNETHILTTFSMNLPRGVYYLDIAAGNESVSIPIRVMNRSEYEAYLVLSSLKFEMERKLFEISEKLSNLTFEVAGYYFGEHVSNRLELLKQKVNTVLKEKIEKFAQILSKYSKTLSRIISERAPETAENSVNWLFDEASSFALELSEKMLTQLIYKYYLLPGIDKYSLDDEKLLYISEAEMNKLSNNAKEFIYSAEEYPVYNLTFSFFEIAPSFSYFAKETLFSTQVSDIMLPNELIELIKADAEAVLLIPVLLGYLNHTQVKIKILPAIPALITTIKVYIGVSKTVSKISPAILLFGSYASSHIISNKLMPSVLEQSYFTLKNIDNCFLNLSSEVRENDIAIHVYSNCKNSNIYTIISKNASLMDYWIEYVNDTLEKNYTFVPNTSGSYLIKSCVFEGSKNIICKVSVAHVNVSLPVLAVVNDFRGVRVINPTNLSFRARIECGNDSEFIIKPYEEKKIECSEKVFAYADGVLTDVENVVKRRRISLCYPSKVFVKSGEGIEIFCTAGTKVKLLSPSGKSYEINVNSTFIPKENGTWEILSKHASNFFIVDKESGLYAVRKGNKIIIINEYGKIVSNAKVVFNGNIAFSDEYGEVKAGNASVIRIYKPGYREGLVFLKEKSFKVNAVCKEPFLEVEIDSLEKISHLYLCVNEVCKDIYLPYSKIKKKFIAYPENKIVLNSKEVFLIKCNAEFRKKFYNETYIEEFIYPNMKIVKESIGYTKRVKIFGIAYQCELTATPTYLKKTFISPACNYTITFDNGIKEIVKGSCDTNEIEVCEEIFKYLD